MRTGLVCPLCREPYALVENRLPHGLFWIVSGTGLHFAERGTILVLCNWSPRALDWIREVHSGISDKRPVVIVHDTPDEVVLPDKQNETAFNDVYIVKGDPATGAESPLKVLIVPGALGRSTRRFRTRQ